MEVDTIQKVQDLRSNFFHTAQCQRELPKDLSELISDIMHRVSHSPTKEDTRVVWCFTHKLCFRPLELSSPFYVCDPKRANICTPSILRASTRIRKKSIDKSPQAMQRSNEVTIKVQVYFRKCGMWHPLNPWQLTIGVWRRALLNGLSRETWRVG